MTDLLSGGHLVIGARESVEFIGANEPNFAFIPVSRVPGPFDP